MNSPLSIPELTQMRADLYAALGNPARSIRRSDGSELVYGSKAEILTAITAIESQLAIAQGGETRVGLAQHKRGDGPGGPGFPWFGNAPW